MAQKMITGYTPSDMPPHIYAEDDAQIYRGVFDTSGILDADNWLDCSIVDNNTVRLSSGVYCNQGYMVCVPGYSSEDLTVVSGTQGVYRKDLIVADFQRGGGSIPDSHAFTVLIGTPAASLDTAADPALIQNDLRAGGARRQEALYRVVLFGTQIIEIVRLSVVVSARDQMPILPLPAQSGTIQLDANKIYAGTINNATLFSLPPPKPGLQNQIMLYLSVTSAATISWTPACIYVYGVTPLIRPGWHYRVVAEYDPVAGRWAVGAIESGELQ